jgi:hypothetical protein
MPIKFQTENKPNDHSGDLSIKGIKVIKCALNKKYMEFVKWTNPALTF